MRGLVWLRTDLRLNDNSALFNASRDCRDGLVVVHFIPQTLNPQSHLNALQYQAQHAQLTGLTQALRDLNIPFIIQEVKDSGGIEAQLLTLIDTHHIKAVYFNRRYDLAQRTQDRALSKTLETMGLQVKSYTDSLIAAPEQLLTPKDKPFTSLAAFKKAWQGVLRHTNIHPLGAVEKQAVAMNIPSASTAFALSATTKITAPWPVDETQALAILQQETVFSWDALDPSSYATHTQQLEALLAHLNNGLISPRQFIQMLLQAEHLQHKNEVDKWLNLLIAREFDHHVMYHFPHICSGHDFTPHMQTLPWQQDQALLSAWQQGKTGYPLIDASMRCLNATGYLPEHLLKSAAIFLSKVLFLDWRLGEQYFAAKRLDYEFASNNALWQWCASTGAESVIYSRIPQPTRQSEVFDARGDFIRQYCPELASINSIGIHEPHRHAPAVAKQNGYPEPIVDYTLMRKKTIYHFKTLNKMSRTVETA